MDISFIIVNYRSRHHLDKCLSSIKESARNLPHEIIVVNNDVQPLVLDGSASDAIVINNDRNSGFGCASNLGARSAKGEFIFFLNPDTEIRFSSLGDLTEALEENDVAIAAPLLILPDGSTQPWNAGNEITFWSVLKNNLRLSSGKKNWTKNEKKTVDWVSGAAFAIKKTVFDNIGGFDENYFMYFEDVDLCRRLRMSGKQILLLPKLKVLHLGGESAQDNLTKKNQYYKSQDFYFEKHFGKKTAFFLKHLRRCSTIFF